MDWMKQTQDLMNGWATSQQQVVEQWLDTLKRYSGTQTMEPYHQALALWESAVKQTLDAQRDWQAAYMNQVHAVDGMPEAAKDMLKQGDALQKQWLDAQGQLWTRWFASVRQMDPTAMMSADFEPQVRAAFSTWQDAAKEMMAMAQKSLDDLMKMTPKL